MVHRRGNFHGNLLPAELPGRDAQEGEAPIHPRSAWKGCSADFVPRGFSGNKAVYWRGPWVSFTRVMHDPQRKAAGDRSRTLRCGATPRRRSRRSREEPLGRTLHRGPVRRPTYPLLDSCVRDAREGLRPRSGEACQRLRLRRVSGVEPPRATARPCGGSGPQAARHRLGAGR